MGWMCRTCAYKQLPCSLLLIRRCRAHVVHRAWRQWFGEWTLHQLKVHIGKQWRNRLTAAAWRSWAELTKYRKVSIAPVWGGR